MLKAIYTATLHLLQRCSAQYAHVTVGDAQHAMDVHAATKALATYVFFLWTEGA